MNAQEEEERMNKFAEDHKYIVAFLEFVVWVRFLPAYILNWFMWKRVEYRLWSLSRMNKKLRKQGK